MSFDEHRKRGVLYGFIPRRLKINDRPELNSFSFNVFFARYKLENEKLIMGIAIYEPDLMSLKKVGNEWSMNYHDVYGGDCWLVIIYDEVENSYVGKKFINGKSAGMAFGSQWNMFFIHFTTLGLADGEMCKFKEIS